MPRRKFKDHVFAIPPCKELIGKTSCSMPVTLSGVDLVNCTLDGTALVSDTPANRSMVKNVRITNCKIYGMIGLGVAFEQVIVDGMQTGPKAPMFFSACVFRHTTFKGAVGRVMLNPVWSETASDEQNQAFHDANADYYRKKKVDWALDIADMEAACFEINGAVPSHLVRRNSVDQFLMRREDVLSGKWKKVKGVLYTPVPFGISKFLATGLPDTVLVAARRSKWYKDELEVYERMRDAGFLS